MLETGRPRSAHSNDATGRLLTDAVLDICKVVSSESQRISDFQRHLISLSPGPKRAIGLCELDQAMKTQRYNVDTICHRLEGCSQLSANWDNYLKPLPDKDANMEVEQVGAGGG